jgi:hypothetical protein
MGPLRTESRRRASGNACRSLLAAGIAFCAAVGSIHATAGTGVVQDLRPLLLEAIDAADGAARGVLAGPPSEVLRRRGVSSEPLEVEVTTLKVYRQPGCKRLNVRFAQRAVKTGDGPPKDRAMAFQLNYCRDGQPPRSLE